MVASPATAEPGAAADWAAERARYEARIAALEHQVDWFKRQLFGEKSERRQVEALASSGPVIILSGALITLTPALIGYIAGRYILKLNPALLLGALTGAMTSTPALNVVTEAAKSTVPALGYAGTYTFANVLLTFAGALMMVL